MHKKEMEDVASKTPHSPQNLRWDTVENVWIISYNPLQIMFLLKANTLYEILFYVN